MKGKSQMISWKLKNRNLQPIGLDIGHNSIKMIQLSMDDGHIRVSAADKTRIAPDINGDEQERREFVISAVRQMLAEGNFRGKDVISCLPNDKLKITSLRLVETEAEEIEQVLREEVAQRFGLNPDIDTVNYVVAGNVQQGDEMKNELVLFVADNETIRSHIEMVEQMGLRPAAIDAVPCALFRSFERSLRRQEDKGQTVVFVDVGSWFTTVVFGRGGQISFVKQIPIGGDKFNRQVAAKLGVSILEAEILRERLRKERAADSSSVGVENGRWASGVDSASSVGLDVSTRQVMVDAIGAVAEELAREISLCFKYYTVTFRGKRVERAVLAGGEAYENILLNVLRRQLTVEIETAQPLRGFDMMNVNFESDKRGLLCEWAVAVGLGLKGFKGATD
jgi:type IV pilus assembly protein PilM